MNRKRLENLIEKTRSETLERTYDRRFMHASVIVRRNRVISVGFNERKTHPIAKAYGYRDAGLHSELAALIQVPRDKRNNLDLINFRFNPQGELRLSKPCKICFPWCVELFNNVYYSDNDGNIVKIMY